MAAKDSEETRKERTRRNMEFWSKKYRREITVDESDEIERNLLAYFEILRRWSTDGKHDGQGV